MSSRSASHVDISELLPWYVNGTLEQEQTKLVDQHLEECPSCRDDYDFLCRMDVAVNKASPAPIVPQPPVDAFLAGLDARNESVQRKSNYLQWGIAASIVAAVLISGPIVSDWILNNEFKVVMDDPITEETIDPELTMDYVLHIEFQPGTSASERNAVFDSLEGRDVVAAEQSNAYRLIVPVPGMSLQELERFTADVERKNSVKSAEAVSIQLPVRKRD